MGSKCVAARGEGEPEEESEEWMASASGIRASFMTTGLQITAPHGRGLGGYNAAKCRSGTGSGGVAGSGIAGRRALLAK